MSVTSERVSVDDTAGGTALNTASNVGQTLRLHNLDATPDSVRLGPSGVTFAAGYELPGETYDTITIRANQVLYAIADTATTVLIDVLRT